jgi:hypothetical protein
LHLTHHCYRR